MNDNNYKAMKSAQQIRELMAALGFEDYRSVSKVSRYLGIEVATFRSWYDGRTHANLGMLMSSFERLQPQHGWLSNANELAIYIHMGYRGIRPEFLTRRLHDVGFDLTDKDPATLDDRSDPRRAVTADVLDHPTPHRGINILAGSGVSEGMTARMRLDEMALVIERKRMRDEPVTKFESQFAATWPQMRQAIQGAEVMLDEADGTRTRNHRIDRTVGSTLTAEQVFLHRRSA